MKKCEMGLLDDWKNDFWQGHVMEEIEVTIWRDVGDDDDDDDDLEGTLATMFFAQDKKQRTNMSVTTAQWSDKVIGSGGSWREQAGWLAG